MLDLWQQNNGHPQAAMAKFLQLVTTVTIQGERRFANVTKQEIWDEEFLLDYLERSSCITAALKRGELGSWGGGGG